MNDSLGNTAIEKIHSIGETGEIIVQNLADNTHGFKTFVELLSTTTWQSHRELTEVWIQKVAQKEYTKILSKDESPEIDEMRACAIDMISEYALDTLYGCIQNLSRWQQIKSKFLVRCTLSQDLPIRDQDRILAKEMGVSYEIWQQMLGFFSHNMEFIDLLQSPENSLEGAIAAGKKWFVLITPEWNTERLSPLCELPGVELIYQSEEDNAPLLFIGDEVLRRYNNIFHIKEKEAIVRDTIRDRFGDIYAYKRFLGGNGKNQTDSEQKLTPERMS